MAKIMESKRQKTFKILGIFLSIPTFVVLILQMRSALIAAEQNQFLRVTDNKFIKVMYADNKRHHTTL
jgi:hypothetical protein